MPLASKQKRRWNSILMRVVWQKQDGKNNSKKKHLDHELQKARERRGGHANMSILNMIWCAIQWICRQIWDLVSKCLYTTYETCVSCYDLMNEIFPFKNVPHSKVWCRNVCSLIAESFNLLYPNTYIQKAYKSLNKENWRIGNVCISLLRRTKMTILSPSAHPPPIPPKTVPRGSPHDNTEVVVPPVWSANKTIVWPWKEDYFNLASCCSRHITWT